MFEESQDIQIITKKLRQKLKENPILISIGDIAEVTGVPQSKIRYWDKCNYINSVQNAPNQSRKYKISDLIKVLIINLHLEEGFTLKSASQKAQKFDEAHNLSMAILEQRFNFHNNKDNIWITTGKLDNQSDKTVEFKIKNGKVQANLKSI